MMEGTKEIMKKVLHPLFYSALLLVSMKTATMAQGSIQAAVSPAAGTSVNLTAEGGLDWSHWGLNGTGQNHKAVGGTAVGLISDIAAGAGPTQFTDSQTNFSWSNGTPTAAATGTINGIVTTSAFSVTVPADTTSRQIKVYVGGFQAGSQFTATLSDGSAAAYSDTSLNSNNAVVSPDAAHFYGVYTLVYKAASAGQTLTINYSQTAGSGNVTMQAVSLAVAPTTAPAAPTALTAIAGTNRVGLQWTGVSGAQSYNVKRGTSASGPFTTLANVANTSYQDTTAVNGTTYYYVVTALNFIGEGANSNVASATPQVGLDGSGITGAYYNSPDVPNPKYLASQLITTQLDPGVNFNVDGTRPAGVPHDQIGVIWTGAVKAPVTGSYVFTTASDDGIRLYIDGVLVVDNFVYQGTTTRNTPAINFTAGSYHTVRVTWFQGGGGGIAQLSWAYPGQGSQIVPTFVLFPDATQFAPPAVTLSGLPGPQSAILKWNTPDNATSYNLLRSATKGGPYTSLKTGITGGTYTDTGLTNGTTYYYVLQAVNAKGTSANSNEVAVIPTPPVIGNGAGLAGTYYAGDNLDFTIAEATPPILYTIAPTVNYTYNNTVSNNPNPFPASLSGLTAGYQHFTAVYNGQFLAPYTGGYQFQTNSDDGSQLSLDSGSGLAVIVNNNQYQGPTTVTSSTINLVAGQKYNIRVDFTQGGGGGTIQLLYSPLGNDFQIIPQTQLFPNFAAAPTTPTNLTAGGGDSAVYLNWSASQFAITYNILRATKMGGPYSIIASGVTTNAYTDAPVTNGTTYYYVVQAVNNIGTTPNSNEASATPRAPVIGAGVGLAGTYYAGGNTDFSAEATAPILYNVVPVINFNQNNAGVSFNPTGFPNGLPGTNLTAVWSGQVLAPFTGTYQFQTITDDGARLTIDSDTATGVVQFDDETGHGPLANTGAPVTLTAGKKYNVKFEYVQGTGGATAQLLYNPVGSGFQIIPQSQLFPNFPAVPGAPINLSAAGGSSLVNLGWTYPQGAITFNVLRSTTSGGPYTTIATGITTTSYTDTAVTNGVTYYYVVVAVNNIGNSPNSNQASATPAVPTMVLHYDFEIGPKGNNPDIIPDTTFSGNDGRAISPDVAGSDAAFTTDAAKGTYAGKTVDATHYIALPDALDLGNQFTFFTYVKLASDSAGGNIQPIFGNSLSGGNGSGIALYVNDYNNNLSHDLVVETNTGPNAGNIQTKATSPLGTFQFDGKYHAVAMVVNRTAGVVNLYYDGIRVLTDATIDTNWSTATGDNRLGQFAQANIVALGSQFDEVRLYNGLLNSTEIAILSGVTPGATATGNIALEGVNDLSATNAAAPLGTFNIQFRTPGTLTVVKNFPAVTLTTTTGSANGKFTVTGIAAGTYDVWIKGAKNLAALNPNVVVSGSTVVVPDSFLGAGDSDNNNTVDVLDFGNLVNSYGSKASDPNSGYDPTVDFDFNGAVDVLDFGDLVNEYGVSGPK